MKTIVWAYACEPNAGSEPGAGWIWARMLATLGETWVVTRSNNRHVIEASLPTINERANLHFEYVDLPSWARGWKRGRRGVHVYYLLWQLAALRRTRRLMNTEDCDVVWHLTLANAWFGSLASLCGPAFVYGPVGGAATAPWRLLATLGPRGASYELLRNSVQAVARYANPLARVSWRRATLILVQNEETRRWIPLRYRDRVEVFPNVVLEHVADPRPRIQDTAHPSVFYAGELLPLKGIGLAVRALVELPGWKLVICGRGPDERRLRLLARRVGVEDRVEFRGYLPRPVLLEMLTKEADVLLFPSLRDQAGWVVAEAIGCGVPVVCLLNGGPPLLGGTGVPVSGRRTTVRALAEATERARWIQPESSAHGRAPREAALRLLLSVRGLLSEDR